MILLDTHVVVWLALDPARISQKAAITIEEERKRGESLAICDITLMEVATLQSKGRINLSVGLESFLQDIESRFTVLSITGRACARAVALPKTYPKDPADRIIGATALVEGMPLITADRHILRSGALPTIW